MKEKTLGYAHRIDLAADVQTVWRALTDPAQLAAWCSPQAEIRARAGGLFRACVDRVTELEAHIDVYEPARRMRIIYLPSSALPPADSVLVDDFILEPGTAGGTILRLLGSGVPGGPAERSNVPPGSPMKYGDNRPCSLACSCSVICPPSAELGAVGSMHGPFATPNQRPADAPGASESAGPPFTVSIPMTRCVTCLCGWWPKGQALKAVLD